MKWCRLDRQVALTEAYQPVREKTISSLRFKLFEIIQNYKKKTTITNLTTIGAGFLTTFQVFDLPTAVYRILLHI